MAMYSFSNVWYLGLAGLASSQLVAHRNPRKVPFPVLGTISYSLYVFHSLIIFPIIRGTILLSNNAWVHHFAWAISIAGSIIASYLAYLLLERPMQRLSKRMRYRELPA